MAAAGDGDGGAAAGLGVNTGPFERPARRTIGNMLDPERFPEPVVQCAEIPIPPPPAVPVGGQRGGGVRQEDEALVQRAITEGEPAWDGIRTALNQFAPSDPARVLEAKNEILRRIVLKEAGLTDTPARQAISDLLDRYIRALEITPEILNYRDQNGTTVLMQAAVNGSWKCIQVLLRPDLRVDPNIQNTGGETALMWAAAYNEISVVRELKKFRNDQNDPRRPINLDYNIVDNLGWNAMMVAAWCGHDAIVQQLADYTDVNRVDITGRNAAKLTLDQNSPARIRGVTNKIIDMLGRWRHPQKGGRNRTPRRSKTNSKKRGTR